MAFTGQMQNTLAPRRSEPGTPAGQPSYQPPQANTQMPTMGGGTIPNPNYMQAQPSQESGGAAPSTATNSNPLQPFYAPNAPMAQASLFQGAQLPSWMNGFLSPQSTIAQILQGFAPQADSATRNLNETLAAAGIAGGPAAGLQTQLQGNLASSLAPTLANAIMQSQGNVLGANEFNAGNTQQAGLSNQNALNNMAQFNTGNIINQGNLNTGYANAAQNQLAQALMNAYGQQFGGFMDINSAGLGGTLGLTNQMLGNSGSLANQEANNFPVYQSLWPQMAQAAAAYYGAGG